MHLLFFLSSVRRLKRANGTPCTFDLGETKMAQLKRARLQGTCWRRRRRRHFKWHHRKGTKSSPERLQTVAGKKKKKKPRPNQLLPNSELPDDFHTLTHSIILFYTLPACLMEREDRNWVRLMRCRLSLFNKRLAQCTEMEGLLEVKTASDDSSGAWMMFSASV